MILKIRLYKALIDCRSDKTGKVFPSGEIVTSKDFPKSVIDNWLKIGVLEEVTKEVDDGSDS